MKKKCMALAARPILMTLFFSFTVLLCSGAIPLTACAHSSGMSGYSGNPATTSGAICTDCHGGGTAPTVTLIGPTSLPTGSSGVYTFTITGGSAVDGGLDVSATTGTLSATGPNTKILNSEITHNAAISFTGGSLSFTFTLVAPPTIGSLTLYAAGLSANGGSISSGDNAAKTSLAVNVTEPSAPHIVITDSVAPTTDHQIPFGTVTDGNTSDKTVTVSNTGNANLVVGAIASANPLAAPFSITADNCSGQTIAPAGACTLIVRFAPVVSGPFSDTFDIPSNDTGTGTVTMSVSGTGTTIPVPVITVTDSVAPNNDLLIPFGSVVHGNTSDRTVTVTNTGNANLMVGAIASANPLAAPFSITTDNCSGQTIAPAGSCTLIVRFAPVVSGPFSDTFDIPSNDTGTGTVTMSVNGTGVNNSPTAPTLVSPADGGTGVGTTATLKWERSTDPDGDAITYHLYYCPGDPSASCTPVDVASSGMTEIYFAGSGLLFLGFVMTRGGRGRKFMLVLMMAMLLTTGVLIVSCGNGGGSSPTPPAASTDMIYQVSGLNNATTYYWKVIADDGKGGLASSPTWSFSTQ